MKRYAFIFIVGAVLGFICALTIIEREDQRYKTLLYYDEFDDVDREIESLKYLSVGNIEGIRQIIFNELNTHYEHFDAYLSCPNLFGLDPIQLEIFKSRVRELMLAIDTARKTYSKSTNVSSSLTGILGVTSRIAVGDLTELASKAFSVFH